MFKLRAPLRTSGRAALDRDSRLLELRLAVAAVVAEEASPLGADCQGATAGWWWCLPLPSGLRVRNSLAHD